MKKILVHTCCAPCFTYIYEDMTNLREVFTKDYGDVDITSFYYNPNIHPKFEFDRRKNTLIDFCNMKGCKLVTSDYYDLHEFAFHDKNHDGFTSRCHYCYRLRLEEAFRYAKENEFDAVLTTLSISPYQNQELIKSIGKSLSKEYGIEYIHLDYTVKFREGQKMAKDLGLYRQKYCGCVFSMDARKMGVLV